MSRILREALVAASYSPGEVWTSGAVGTLWITVDAALRIVVEHDVSHLRTAIEAELGLLPDESEGSPFEYGAAAAYHHVLSLLDGAEVGL